MTMTQTLSRTARETLDELGIDLHEIRDGMVYMGDQQGGPYLPATVVQVEAACRAADSEPAADVERRFDLFHGAL
jgi:hypothetical protein